MSWSLSWGTLCCCVKLLAFPKFLVLLLEGMMFHLSNVPKRWHAWQRVIFFRDLTWLLFSCLMSRFGARTLCCTTCSWFENNEGIMCEIVGAVFTGISVGLVNVWRTSTASSKTIGDGNSCIENGSCGASYGWQYSFKDDKPSKRFALYSALRI